MLNLRRIQSGFTLLEVLVAVLVLSIGLLGLAGLQAHGLKTNHSAYLRSQASMLAYDILDVLRSDRQAALNGGYNLALGDAAPSGGTVPQSQLNNWLTERVERRLPQGDGAVQVSSGRVTITIQWNDARSGGSSSQQFIYQTQL
ncbi:type IV pilus modification protein PilV [Methylococcus sp. EFPC2]|uniref:type IV pilus modification protein PilV n=1 Tax=Methylococcus sp. EFPC2 TaxID=2812648 RepID=UPI0019677126|nr:type IV pilus modification protein PilV [Methylococcus sp. EFPC2]QSA96725.1 type IV pilus modification protein PilV [Methylococcus sp. EFPC2]